MNEVVRKNKDIFQMFYNKDNSLKGWNKDVVLQQDQGASKEFDIDQNEEIQNSIQGRHAIKLLDESFETNKSDSIQELNENQNCSMPSSSVAFCKYFVQGKCRQGSSCKQTHPKNQSLFKFCNLCQKDILAAGSLFGLLSTCDHAFCNECIKSYRAHQTADRDRNRCPKCKVYSKQLIPQPEFIDDSAEKESIREKHYDKLKAITCKQQKKNKTCPYGKNCFYKHQVDK